MRVILEVEIRDPELAEAAEHQPSWFAKLIQRAFDHGFPFARIGSLTLEAIEVVRAEFAVRAPGEPADHAD